MGAEWIVQFGNRFIGSHYLWGAAGARPQENDGAWYRHGSVSLDADAKSNEQPSVFAATCDVAGHYVCSGNFKHFMNHPDQNNGFNGGYAHASDKQLTDYLDTLRKLGSDSFWYPYQSRFTPRVMKGQNLGNDDNKIVWGEDCRYVRHFDCIGFVNFVLSLTTGHKWAYSIQQYQGGMTGATSVPFDDPPEDGDILVRDGQGEGHIAFLRADGQVLQAEDHSSSVHAESTYSAKQDKDGKVPNWTKRLRVPSKLVNSAGVMSWDSRMTRGANLGS
jgi:hypothetical protein